MMLHKRDGTLVPFDQEKITQAIFKAMLAVETPDHDEAVRCSNQVRRHILKRFHPRVIPGVEQIQDIVEEVLIARNHPRAAKAYILYRDRHGRLRESRSLLSDIKQIMDGCFKILMDAIHRYEGTINQFTGDGVMALFGAPVAHEDHAQRACRAALSIRKAIEGYRQKLQTDRRIEFKMRIGLNSGPVVVGSIGDDLRMDYTAVGDTRSAREYLTETLEIFERLGTLIEPDKVRQELEGLGEDA